MKQNDTMHSLYQKIIWFENRNRFDFDFFEILEAQRKVSDHPRYRSGVFYSEKCKREVQYESGIELEFIKTLEKSNKVLFYYEQPAQIHYWRGRRKQTYTPDFLLFLVTKEIVLVEIKDLPGMLDYRVQAKIEGLLKFCSERGFGLLLTDGKHTIDKIKKIRVNKKLEKEILCFANQETLRKKECNQIMKDCNCTQNELLKVILKNDLRYRPFPFRLQKKKTPNTIFRHVLIEKKPYEEMLTEIFITLFDRKLTK